MKNPKLQIGDRFRIKGNTHKNRTFTVIAVDEAATDKEFAFTCTDQFGDKQCFSQINIDYYGENVRIIESAEAESVVYMPLAKESRHCNGREFNRGCLLVGGLKGRRRGSIARDCKQDASAPI